MIIRIVGYACLSWLAFSSSAIIAQEATWATLLQEADQGEKTLEQILSARSEVTTIATEEDLSAIRSWIQTFDPTQLNDKPNRVENLNRLLGQLIGFEYSEHPQISTSSVQSELERQLRHILTLQKSDIEPLQQSAMRMLHYLIMTESKRSPQILVATADNKYLQNSEYWSTVLYSTPNESPAFAPLREKVLSGVIAGRLAVILVEHDNDIAFESEDFTHFLSCPEGENILRQWLSTDLEDDMKSYDAAKQAAISLAFLRSSDWREFIQIARNHPDANVVLEGAWAGARRQHEESISHLVELAKDVRYSRTAVNYLNELSLESRVPTETTSPEFAAQAELCQWLAYPTEKGRAPDLIKIADKRKLKWPLEDQPVNVYLIEFTYKDPTGAEADEIDIGLVGPMTFCHFDMKMTARPKEDVYAIHVFRELEAYELITKVDLAEQPSAFDYMLKAWKGEALADSKINYVAKLEPSVDYPRRLLALASATKNGEEGYVVLDGPRSKWYPKKDLVPETPVEAVLMIHLGRQLLGL
jgi:hypothetical protein